MSDTLYYKDYYGRISYDADEKVLKGQILNIRDTVEFEIKDISKAGKEFHAAVDKYVETKEKLRRQVKAILHDASNENLYINFSADIFNDILKKSDYRETYSQYFGNTYGQPCGHVFSGSASSTQSVSVSNGCTCGSSHSVGTSESVSISCSQSVGQSESISRSQSVGGQSISTSQSVGLSGV